MSGIHSTWAALIWSQMFPCILYPTAAVFVGLYLYSLGLATIVVTEYLTLLVFPGAFAPDNNEEDDDEDDEQDDDSDCENPEEDGEDNRRKTASHRNYQALARYPKFLTISAEVDEDEQTSDSDPIDTPSPSTEGSEPGSEEDNREQPSNEAQLELLDNPTDDQTTSPIKTSDLCKRLDDALEQWRQDKAELYSIKVENERLMAAIIKLQAKESALSAQLRGSNRDFGTDEEVEDDDDDEEMGYAPLPGEEYMRRTWSL